MEINKVEFLKLAKEGKKGHNIFIEFIIAFIILFLGGLATVFIQYPIVWILTPLLKNIYGTPEFSTIISLFSTLGMTLIVILYCKFIEKRSLASMGFVKENMVKEYLKGLLVGFILFTLAIGISIVAGGTKIIGFSSDINYLSLFLLLIGFILQGMSEEVLCRGYLMVSVGKRYGLLVGSVFNSVIFGLLHLGNSGINLISIINIILVGLVFSFYMIRTGNIWGVGAAHSMWNFAQGNIYGGSVSGINAGTSILESQQIGNPNLINGGIFGIEGSIATTIVLLIFLMFLVKDIKFIADKDYIDYHLE